MTRALVLIIAMMAMQWATQGTGHAQASRTWVSANGDDAFPCSRTEPCKTFAGAIIKTAAGGEISVLDSGGFGIVAITKSISIVAEGSEGSIVATSSTGIVVDGANIEVNLRGLFLEASTGGLDGIRVERAKSVNIRNCLIRGFDMNANAAGIRIKPASGATKVVVSNCSVTKNQTGIIVEPTGTGTADVLLENLSIMNNTRFGVRVTKGGKVTVSDSVLTTNGTGFSKGAGAHLVSLGNNVVDGNTANGAPTITMPLK